MVKNLWLWGPILACIPALAAGAEGDTPWYENDLESRVSRVSDGELEFLAAAPAGVHEHRNVFTIDAASLADGWVGLEQCHHNLDAVPRAQVVFSEGRIRALEVVRAGNMERAWVEGHTVQLQGVEPGAELCVRAESRALAAEGDGRFTLRNGPFMRRFLDGYYPMVVTMEVHYPCGALELTRVAPPRQEGFRVTSGECAVELSAAFQGQLETELGFRDRR